MSKIDRSPELDRKAEARAAKWRPMWLPDVSTPFLLGTFTAFLVLFGLVMTLSASTVYSLQTTGSAYTVFFRQLAWIGIGAIALVICASVPPRTWRRLAVPLFVVAAGLLVLVLVPGLGINVNGSSRWLGSGSLRIQPSEVAKLGIVLVSALILDRKYKLLDDPAHMLVPLIVPCGVVVAALLLVEPDFGTTLIIAAILLVTLFVGGARLVHIAWTAGGLASAAGVMALAKQYLLARFFVFLNPWQDPQGAGYQVVQSLIAIGSGGPGGLGLGASRQKWMFLPNAHTDFMYSVIAEELGLFGSFAVLILLFGLVLFCVRAAQRAPDRFGALVATGVATWIAVQTVQNLLGVTSLAPVDGAPLPLMSVGGSSASVLMAAIGIVIAIGREGDRALARQEREVRRRRSTKSTKSAGDHL